MEPATIAFLGCGNMGRCLISGLIKDNYPENRIRAADSQASQLATLSEWPGILATSSSKAAIDGSTVIVLAVKPQQMRPLAAEIAPHLQGSSPLIVSVAAGIRAQDLRRWLGELPIVRAMPNTPALLGCGVSGLYADQGVTPDQRELAEAILRAVGMTVWVEQESLLDAVTAVSGSGPAYFFAFMEWIENAGVDLGLSREQARLLTLQTALGAARMAIESEVDPATLRKQVTSPGGTTERALQHMHLNNLPGILHGALSAARDRAAELARQFGETS